MAEIIRTENLQYAYPADEGAEPVLALKGVDLTIEQGSFVVVLGHNGSGKSTLAKTLNGVLLPCGGHVYVEGMDTLDEHLLLAIRRTVGMVFQNPDNQIVANVAGGRRPGGGGHGRVRPPRAPSALRRPEAADRHCRRAGYGAGMHRAG